MKIHGITQMAEKFMNLKQTIFTGTIVISTLIFTPAYAKDARSIAMGNTGITTGKGVNGAMLNPALLMKHKKLGQSGSGSAGLSLALLNKQKFDDLHNKVDDLHRDVNQINLAVNTMCQGNINDIDNKVCISDATGLRNISSDAKELINDLSGQSHDLNLDYNYFGVSILGSIPFALSIAGNDVRHAAFAPDNADLTYLDSIINHASSSDVITTTDIKNSQGNITINNGKIAVADPNSTLKSNILGYGVSSFKIKAGVADATYISDLDVYYGLTPKVMFTNASEEILYLKDHDSGFVSSNDSEKTIFSVDAGLLFPKAYSGLDYALVISDALPYEVSTASGIKIKTTPQLKIGAGYESTHFNIAIDAALNKAKKNGIDTQPIGIGIEGTYKWLALRAGLSNDIALENNAISYSVGAAISVFNIGFKFNENAVEAAIQVTTDSIL